MGFSNVRVGEDEGCDDDRNPSQFLPQGDCLSVLEKNLNVYLKKLSKVKFDRLSDINALNLKDELDKNVEAADTLCTKFHGDFLMFGESDMPYVKTRHLFVELKKYQTILYNIINED